MKFDYKDDAISRIDYGYRIQMFEMFLMDELASEEYYAKYKAGFLPEILYEHNIPVVLSLFRKEFLNVKRVLKIMKLVIIMIS